MTHGQKVFTLFCACESQVCFIQLVLPESADCMKLPWPESDVVTLKWKAEGMRTAMTAISSREALSCAAVALMVCSAKRTPPAKKHLSDQYLPGSRWWDYSHA